MLATGVEPRYQIASAFHLRRTMAGMDSALRRINVIEPVSRLAILATRCAQASLVLAAIALVAAHSSGALARFFAVLTLRHNSVPDPAVGLFFFVVALAVALAAVMLAIGAAASIWIKGRRGVGRIFSTLLLVSLLAPYPAYLVYSAGSPPFLSDISTDVDDPPQFSTSADVVAGRFGWTPAPLDPARRQEQAASYPDVQPMTLNMELDEAFKATHDAVEQLRWTILEEARPGGPNRPEGRIEALTRSPALSLPVAISIRIRPGDDETRVDMRAVTRYLPNDLGAGANLIGKLSDTLEEKDSSN
jgi:hypothetical protein